MANFNLFIPEIQAAEGGYQDYDSDTGNYNSIGENVGTNHGINAKVYERYIGRVPTVLDMQNMSAQTALEIFKNQYWDRVKADQINSQPVAETLTDMTINAGGNGIKIMQRTLNQLGHDLTIDGGFGNLTLAAVNATNQRDLFVLYNVNRLEYYENLRFTSYNTWRDFMKSWKNRVQNMHDKHVDFLSQIVSTVKSNPKKSIASVGIFSLLSILFYKYLNK